MVFRRAAVAAALLVLAVSPAICADFTMGRFDANQTGCTTEKLQLPLILDWEFTGSKFTNNASAPVVADGVCYYSCGDKVFAIDLETGNQKWRYPSDQGLSGFVKVSPAIYNGNVYFGASDGNLYCINAATGTFQWAYQTRGAIRCPPVIVDGIIYVGTDDDSVYAINADTGESAWNKPATAKDDFANGIAIGGGVITAASMDGLVYGISSSVGKLRWVFRMTSAPIRTSPIISETLSVITAGDTVYGLGAKSGQMRWVINLPSEAAATPATDGQTLFVPCRDKKLYAYVLQSRKPAMKWTQPIDLGTIPTSSPTISGDVLYIAGSKGVVAAYSTLDGTLKWRYVIAPSGVNAPGADYTDASSSPVVANGNLLVVTDDGVLHCFTPFAPDNTAPQALKLKPTNGSSLSGAPPIKMSAILYDQGSGVDFSSLSMTLDGQSVTHTIDYPTSTVSYTTDIGAEGKPVRALKDGMHTIGISVKDYAGNLLNQEWYFLADSSLPPPKIIRKDTGKKTKEPARGKRNRGQDNQQGPGNPTMPPMPGGLGGPGYGGATYGGTTSGGNTPGGATTGGAAYGGGATSGGTVPVLPGVQQATSSVPSTPSGINNPSTPNTPTAPNTPVGADDPSTPPPLPPGFY